MLMKPSLPLALLSLHGLGLCPVLPNATEEDEHPKAQTLQISIAVPRIAEDNGSNKTEDEKQTV